VNGLLAPLDLALEGFASKRLGGGDHVHRHDAELSQDLLVVDSAKRCVIDDRLCSWNVWRKTLEAGDGDRSFGAGIGYGVEVQDEPADGRARPVLRVRRRASLHERGIEVGGSQVELPLIQTG
jgi:hypothetical protein